ncbi:MAG: ABC transporter ATP-binding protein, partial [Paeniclostridium sordellii]|nr:ABC transporter ATP-binding protein [Staphylococcus warneri]MDU2149654.1 ABC transporter ATP-binding protein [Paeniclostridium sordellii]
MNPVIQTKQLSKKFKHDYGLQPTDFNLYEGEICAIIGRNGAGKSTLFKLIANQIHPTSGSIKLFGEDGYNINNQGRKRVGFMIETPEFISNFTAYQNLYYFSIQRGVTNSEKIEEVLTLVDLKNITKKVKQYSLGMKQRLGIALALLTGPDILVLDEPINGLDAQGIKSFRDLILKLNEENGITILISSHILNELQQLAYRFVFIENGEIIEDISKEQMLSKGKRQLIIKVDKPESAVRILEEHIENI